MLFNPLEATVEVGSNITITCWSNQEAVLQLAYNQGPVLASSSGRSVIYTLVDVQENESGVIYCVGMVGEVSNTAEYHLTVCKLYGCVVWTCIITVHVTSYLQKSDEFCGNPLRLSVKTCAEISRMYSASLRIVCSESADCLHLC